MLRLYVTPCSVTYVAARVCFPSHYFRLFLLYTFIFPVRQEHVGSVKCEALRGSTVGEHTLTFIKSCLVPAAKSAGDLESVSHRSLFGGIMTSTSLWPEFD